MKPKGTPMTEPSEFDKSWQECERRMGTLYDTREALVERSFGIDETSRDMWFLSLDLGFAAEAARAYADACEMARASALRAFSGHHRKTKGERR